MRRTLDIDDLAPGGEGVGREGTRSLFVPFTAPGDRVEVEPVAGAGAAHARLRRLLTAGPDRVVPPCPHFGEPLEGGEREAAAAPEPEGPADRGCGGCEWLHLAYRAQLAAKARSLAETLRRIGRLDAAGAPLLPPIESPSPLRYRSRAKFHLDRRSGRLAFFRRRSHEPVRLRECWLLEPALDALRERMGPALGRVRLAPRQVALEWSERDGRGSAWLDLGEPTPAARERAGRLLGEVPGLQGLVLSGAEGAPALAGDPVLRHQRAPGEAGTARSRPDVFRQANRLANARLVGATLDLLRPEGEDVLELFCGSGNFTVPLARRARGVWAVEAQGPALDLARLDLEEDPAAGGRARLFAGDALAMARAFARERGPAARRFGAVLLDPPREGARGLGPLLRDLAAPRAVYVSCDPATLARDLRGCVEAGYRVAAVQPVDMFPQTHHVEAVALLER